MTQHPYDRPREIDEILENLDLLILLEADEEDARPSLHAPQPGGGTFESGVGR